MALIQWLIIWGKNKYGVEKLFKDLIFYASMLSESMIPVSKLVKCNSELQEYCVRRKAEGMIMFQRLTGKILKK